MNKELTEAIEKLGDLLGIVSELSTSIYNEIKNIKQEPMHNKYIWKVKSHIGSAEYYYTMFHRHIWE